VGHDWLCRCQAQREAIASSVAPRHGAQVLDFCCLHSEHIIFADNYGSTCHMLIYRTFAHTEGVTTCHEVAVITCRGIRVYLVLVHLELCNLNLVPAAAAFKIGVAFLQSISRVTQKVICHGISARDHWRLVPSHKPMGPYRLLIFFATQPLDINNPTLYRRS
jgi:hypothetical protein